MKIGMILHKYFPPDIRVEKEARLLKRAGHEIFIFCKKEGSSQVEEKTEDCTIVRFDPNEFKTLKNIAHDFKVISFSDPVWRRGIDRFVRSYGIEAIHVHDLPFVKTAYAVAKKYRIPIIADYHENFPACIQARLDRKLQWKERFYQSYRRWANYEENISHKVDKIIVVAEEYKQHLISEHGIPEEKITIAQNTIDLSMIKENPTWNDKGDFADEFILSYVGSYGVHRGLDVVIKGMPEVLSYNPNAKFVIVGQGSNQQELERTAKELKVEESVKFIDWMKYDDLVKEFGKASIGLIPHHSSEHTDNTIPNKLFEYMYFKVPVLTSDCPPLKRIVNETKAGKVFKAGDARDFAEKVMEIYRDPADYGEMGNRAVMEKYNWNIDGERLVNLYNSL